MATNAQKLQYKKLSNDDSIRLLVLDPGAASADLEGKLQEFRIKTDDCPDYDALSYAWGAPVFPDALYVFEKGDGEQYQLPITTSLCSALKRLRRRERRVVLWVDAICINQEDQDEKNHQVGLMSLVYSTAARVLIWLGVGDGRNESAVACCEQFAKDARGFGVDFEPDGQFGLESPSERKIQGSQAELTEHVDRAKETGLLTLATSAWFGRLWVVQEVTLAKCPVLLYGPQEVPWTVFGKAISLISEAIQATQNNIVKEHYYLFFRTLQIVKMRSRFRSLSNQRVMGSPSYGYILEHFGHFRFQACTNDRDRVHALLALRRPGDGLLTKPDYSLSVHETYRDFARSVLAKQGIHILELAGLWARAGPQQHLSPSDAEYLPSWAPDFRPESSRLRLPKFPKDFDMATGRDPQIVPSPHLENSFWVDGSVFDSLFYLVDIPSQEDDSEVAVTRSMVAPFKALYDSLQLNKYPTGENILSAFVRTLIADARHDDLDDPIIGWQAYEKYILTDDGEFMTMLRGPALRSENKTIGDAKKTSLVARQAFSFMKLMVEAFGQLTLVITQKKYLGIVPWGTEPNDDIAVFAGARYPYIVRYLEGYKAYKLVGPCYVHGLMCWEPEFDNPVGKMSTKAIPLI